MTPKWEGGWSGATSSSLSYYPGDLVSYQNIVYIVQENVSIVPIGSPPPPNDMSNWEVFASGAIGTNGSSGSSGTSGSTDFATLATTSTSTSISNTNSETAFSTNLAVTTSDNLVGAIYELHYSVLKGPAGHSSTWRLYVNTSNDLTGSPIKVLENGTGFNSNTLISPMFRYFRNSVGLIVPRDVNAAQTVWSNIQTQTLSTTTPIGFTASTTYYFVITTQMGVTNSTETLQFAKLCIKK
jgi:hypothetical protein